MTNEKHLSHLKRVSRVGSWPYFSRDPEAYKKQVTDYRYIVIEGFEKPFGHAHSDFVKKMTWSSIVWSVDHEKHVLKLHSPDELSTTDTAGARHASLGS